EMRNRELRIENARSFSVPYYPVTICALQCFRGHSTGDFTMLSPFPGMDPYLEAHWGDVHASLVTYARDALQPDLPRDLRERMEERVTVESPLDETRIRIPDVRILEERRRSSKRRPGESSALALAEPLILTGDDEVTETFIEIRDKSSGNRIVTVIEVLSP